MKQLLKHLALGTCVWFTLLALALMLIRAIVSGIDGGIIEISRFLLLLPCGLFLSGAGMVRRQTTIAGWLRLLLHYLLTTLAFFLFLWLPSGGHTGAKNLAAIAFFTLGYALVRGLILLVRHRFRSIREED